MADESIYLGLPGALQKIWWPSGGMDETRTRDSSTFATGAGGMRMSKLLNGVRVFALDYAGLGRDNFNLLDAYNQGHMGPGPYVFIDPARRNMLTVNQSASTSATNDTTDFTVAGVGGSISSDSSQTILPPVPGKALKWSFASSAPASATLSLNKPTFWPGWPVIPRAYSFGVDVFGGVGAVSLQATLTWLDANGAVISTATGPATNTVVGGWLTVAIQGALPPATAVWVLPGIAASGASIAAGEFVIMSGFQMNEGATLDIVWAPGTGVYPVQVVSQRDIVPYQAPDFRKGNTLLLQELR